MGLNVSRGSCYLESSIYLQPSLWLIQPLELIHNPFLLIARFQVAKSWDSELSNAPLRNQKSFNPQETTYKLNFRVSLLRTHVLACLNLIPLRVQQCSPFVCLLLGSYFRYRSRSSVGRSRAGSRLSDTTLGTCEEWNYRPYTFCVSNPKS